METSFEIIKRIIENCRFAAMKYWGLENLLQKRCITETVDIKEDGTLECIAHDAAHPSKKKLYTKNSKVDLKYINKEQNIYLTIKGQVTDVQYEIKETSHDKPENKNTVYRIKILEAEFYERKYYSRSMSILLRKKKQHFFIPAA